MVLKLQTTDYGWALISARVGPLTCYVREKFVMSFPALESQSPLRLLLECRLNQVAILFLSASELTTWQLCAHHCLAISICFSA